MQTKLFGRSSIEWIFNLQGIENKVIKEIMRYRAIVVKTNKARKRSN